MATTFEKLLIASCDNGNEPADVVLHWVYDECYQTRGSYAYDTDEETRKAEEWELERLRDGRLVVLGCIVIEKCPECGNEVEKDDLWGIVIEPTTEALMAFAKHQGWIGKDADVTEER